MRHARVLTVQRPGAPRTGLRASLVGSTLLLAAALLFAGSPPARAAMYKWVDDKGVVHYTDKMPPDAVDKASIELNPQGIPIRKTEPTPTAEQRRAKEQEDERKRQEARQQEELSRRDRALMSSYTNEAEIDLARNRSLQTIRNVVQSSQAYSEQLTKRNAEAEAKKVEFKGKPVIPALDRELESIDSELARQAELVAQKQQEAAAITAKYDADKQRWRELVATKAITDPAKSARAPSGTGAGVAPAAGTAKK